MNQMKYSKRVCNIGNVNLQKVLIFLKLISSDLDYVLFVTFIIFIKNAPTSPVFDYIALCQFLQCPLLLFALFINPLDWF